MEKQLQIEKKLKTILKPVFGNPMKRSQVTGHIKVGVEDGTDFGPDRLPDGTPLLTKAELMELKFETAGRPTKGSQPPEDFKSDTK